MLKYCINNRTCNCLVNVKREREEYIKTVDSRLYENVISNSSNFKVPTIDKGNFETHINEKFFNKP